MKKIDHGELHAILKPLADSSRPITKIRNNRWLYECVDVPFFLFIASENAPHSERMIAIQDQAALIRYALVRKQTANPTEGFVDISKRRVAQANFQLLLNLTDDD